MSPMSSRPLSIDIERRDDAAVVHVHGSADVDSADVLRKPLEEVAAEQRPLIVLDLSDLDFIGSTGLAMLVFGYLRSRRHNGRVCVAAPQPIVRDIMTKTRLDTLLPVYDGVDEALRS